MKKYILFFIVCLFMSSCGPTLRAQRMTTEEGDKEAMTITDEWVATDTNLAVKSILKKLLNHRRYQEYLDTKNNTPKLMVGIIENQTSEDNFPITALNNKLVNDIFESGDFNLISAKDRERVLNEIKFQNSGLVKESEMKKIGRMSGADLLMSGEVVMQDKILKGRTLKEYSLTIRLVDIESGEEVARALYETTKYSQKKGFGW